MVYQKPRCASPGATAMEEVLGNEDLLVHILSGNVGLRTYVIARQVNKAFQSACANSTALTRAVALHNGGLLTKKEFVGMFSLTYQEGGRYEHVVSGKRHMFGAAAIDQALARPECMVLMRMDAVSSRLDREAYLLRRYGPKRPFEYTELSARLQLVRRL